MSTEHEKVARGMGSMDVADPGWWRADIDRPIDLNLLDLASPAECVLGQRCPLEVLADYHRDDPRHPGRHARKNAFFAYAKELSGIVGDPVDPNAAFDRLIDWAVERGFTARTEAEFKPLTAEWSERIRERRAAA